MSDDVENEKPAGVTVESKTSLLKGWIRIIQNDIAILAAERDLELDIYLRQKKKSDDLLAKRYHRITRAEKIMSARQKEIDKIESEINRIETSPPPGILPAVPDKPKRRGNRSESTEKSWLPTKMDDVVASDDFAFSDEDRRKLNEEVQSEINNTL